MPIWEWVLVSVLIQHNTWREMGLDPVPIGVNLSTTQLVDPAARRAAGGDRPASSVCARSTSSSR